MRTRIKDFLDMQTMKPAFSFQYLTGTGGWRCPARSDRTAITWATESARAKARACFSHRKTPDRAHADLHALHLIPATTTEKEKAMPEVTIPEGYMRDAQGRLVPLSLIKPVDQERDRLVRELSTVAENLHADLVKAKTRIFGDVAAFADLSAEQYGVKRGGKKGNITLHTFDGEYKLQLATAEALTFDERLQAAKSLIDECITEWARGSRPEIMALVQQAFQTDKEGNLNVGRILALRRLEITDERWQEAMRAIGESIQVIGSKQYVRFYKRVGDTDRYAPISLDMVAV